MLLNEAYQMLVPFAERRIIYMTKKKVMIVIVLVGIVILFTTSFMRSYRVENVFDEIALTNRKFWGKDCTKTDFMNFTVSFESEEVVRYYGYKEVFFYDVDSQTWYCDCIMKKRGIFSIVALEEHINGAHIELRYQYSLWNKKVSKTLIVYKSTEDTERAEGPIGSKNEIDRLLQEEGTTFNEVCMQAEAEIKKMLDDWIISNEGKSKFAAGNYGKYSESELVIFQGNEYQMSKSSASGSA